MIDIEHLRFAWPGARTECLDIERFELGAAQSVFLHGPSGSGKSTLLGLVAGVLVTRQGRVKLLDKTWSDLSARGRDAHRADHVGYIFQQFNLLPYLDVLQNVVLPCQFSRVRRERAVRASGSVEASARSLLSQMGVPASAWSRPASQTSVGQQQRIAAARALIGEPEVVIADEPTSSLDAQSRDEFLVLLANQCRNAGSALMFVSHDLSLASRFDRSVSLPQINRATRAADDATTGAVA